jgi:uncharacterized protein YndB with AHSA1/START domain
MTGGSYPITIDAPPERIWPFIADVDRHASWSPQPFAIEWTKGEPNAVGSTFHSAGEVPGDKDHHNDSEITEVVPFERFAFVSHDIDGDYENVYTLTPAGGGTEVVHTLRFPPRMKRLLPRLLGPVVFPIVGAPRFRKRMQILKEKVEATPAT